MQCKSSPPPPGARTIVFSSPGVRGGGVPGRRRRRWLHRRRPRGVVGPRQEPRPDLRHALRTLNAQVFPVAAGGPRRYGVHRVDAPRPRNPATMHMLTCTVSEVEFSICRVPP